MKSKKAFYFLIILGVVYNLVLATPKGREYFHQIYSYFESMEIKPTIFTQPKEYEI